MATTTARAEISFNTVYAAYQHEKVDLHHPKGGNAKYLEGPLKQFAPTMATFVAAKVRAAIAAGHYRSGIDVAHAMGRELENAVGAFAEIVGGAAVAEAPVDEGTLRGSMEISTGKVREAG